MEYQIVVIRDGEEIGKIIFDSYVSERTELKSILKYLTDIKTTTESLQTANPPTNENHSFRGETTPLLIAENLAPSIIKTRIRIERDQSGYHFNINSDISEAKNTDNHNPILDGTDNAHYVKLPIISNITFIVLKKEDDKIIETKYKMKLDANLLNQKVQTLTNTRIESMEGIF